MDFTRREFLGTVTAVAALTESAGTADGQTEEDPLGVRSDFPVVNEGTYLNSPYITPSPRQAVEAAQSFAEQKARNPVSLGGMLDETDAVRRKFAHLIGASEREVGILFATSDGENIVSRALDLSPGDNVVIEKDVSIGNNVTIGAGTVVKKNATIGNDVVIGAGVVIGIGATIDDGADIPDGTVIQNGAVVEP